MENHTIDNFKRWDEVEDYESDENSVTLLDKNGVAIAEYGFSKFDTDDYNHYKKNKNEQSGN